ncbi:MAG: hypothetical protein RLZZ04_790 [Cyanobacteriota bacterium]|jgi:hypothetical protein
MNYLSFICSSLLLFSLAACTSNQADKSLLNSSSPATSGQKPDSRGKSNPEVINLTQVGCQFLEVEGKNYQYQPQNADDCKKINGETLTSRESGFKPLELKSGKYIFRVTNSNVPYPLGFYLRGKGIKQVSLPKVSGGGLTQGITKDYEVDLTTGDYVFSCPLNPTPDYPLVVN